MTSGGTVSTARFAARTLTALARQLIDAEQTPATSTGLARSGSTCTGQCGWLVDVTMRISRACR